MVLKAQMNSSNFLKIILALYMTSYNKEQALE